MGSKCMGILLWGIQGIITHEVMIHIVSSPRVTPRLQMGVSLVTYILIYIRFKIRDEQDLKEKKRQQMSLQISNGPSGNKVINTLLVEGI